MTKRSTGLVLLVLVVILSVGYLYREYNRKPPDLTKSQPEAIASTDSILELFSKDEHAANARYLGKVLQLTGMIRSKESDKNGFVTVVLGDESKPATVRCSIDSLQTKKAQLLKERTMVTVRGVCTGYSPDELGLGADLILNRCIVLKN